MYPTAYGTLNIYEKGAFIGNFGNYVKDQKLRVSVEGGVVKYWNGTTLLRSTPLTSAYPLLLDTALYSPDATITNAVIHGQLETWAGSVEWANAVGVAITGSSLKKTAGWNWANAGASSMKAIASGDGYVEFTISEAYTYRMLGLSNGDTNQDFTDIDFAIYPTATGTIEIYEKGVPIGHVGDYAVGDKLRVSVQSGAVKYWKNETLLHASTQTPTYPLLVDTAFYSPDATVTDVVLHGQLLTLVEHVKWLNDTAGGVVISGNSLTKTAYWGWGNAGAVSTKALASGDGYVEFTVSETYTYRMLGLSNGDSNLDFTDIDFAIFPTAADIEIYEKSVPIGHFGAYAIGDRLRVSIQGGVVRYWRNGILLHTSSQTPTYPLLVDTSFYSPDATVTGVVISGDFR